MTDSPGHRARSGPGPNPYDTYLSSGLRFTGKLLTWIAGPWAAAEVAGTAFAALPPPSFSSPCPPSSRQKATRIRSSGPHPGPGASRSNRAVRGCRCFRFDRLAPMGCVAENRDSDSCVDCRAKTDDVARRRSRCLIPHSGGVISVPRPVVTFVMMEVNTSRCRDVTAHQFRTALR